MRVFVSSSFEDLQEYRIAAIRALRQLVHEVVAMEDFVAASGVPLKQMLDKVERCNPLYWLVRMALRLRARKR
jgi:hypothetical protein